MQEMPKLRITHDLKRIDLKQVQAMLKDSYWVPGIALKRVRLIARNSFLVAALIDKDGRVYAYGRAVSDGSRFAYMADIIVHPDWRGRGLGKRLVASLLEHRSLRDVDGWLLQTQDAHTLYHGFGFGSPPFPERILVRTKVDCVANQAKGATVASKAAPEGKARPIAPSKADR
jgi:N-acetylglutamate synthase-like GNAT family acetyltransferase